MDIMELIQNIAFPIAMSGVLLKMLVDEKDSHKTEMESFVKALDNNTAAIERVVDMFEKVSGESVNRGEINGEKRD